MNLPRTGRGFRRTLASLAVLGFCLFYLYTRVNLEEFTRALASVKLSAFAGLVAYALFMRLPQSLRVYYLADRRASIWVCFQAIFIRLGVNNVLPARLGDGAMVFFLANNGGLGYGKSLEVYFWSHVMNLMLVLATGLMATSRSGIPFVSDTLLLLTVLLLVGMVALVAFGKNMLSLLRELPDNRLVRLVMAVIDRLSDKKPPGFYPIVLTLSVLTFVMSGGLVFLVLHYATGLSLSMSQTLLVFTATLFCEVVPSTPGNIGIFESAVVLVLGFCAIPEGQALVGALVLHAFMYVPSGVLGCVFLVMSGTNFSGLRNRDGEGLSGVASENGK